MTTQRGEATIVDDPLTSLAGQIPRICGQDPDEIAPDGSLIYWLRRNEYASTCLCVLPPGHQSLPARHPRLQELWYVMSGQGQLYRSSANGGLPVALRAGVGVSIAAGEVFQFCAHRDSALTIHITTTPPWAGEHDVETGLTGYW